MKSIMKQNSAAFSKYTRDQEHRRADVCSQNRHQATQNMKKEPKATEQNDAKLQLRKVQHNNRSNSNKPKQNENKKGKAIRHNKSLADIQSFFGKAKEDKLKENYKEIYDKVQKASSLLRSRSSERNGSLVRQYEIASKRNQFIKTQNHNLTLSKLNCTSGNNLLNQTISTRNLSPNNNTCGFANSLNLLRSGEKCFGSFIKSSKNADLAKESSHSPKNKSPRPQIGPKLQSNYNGHFTGKQIIQNKREDSCEPHIQNVVDKIKFEQANITNKVDSLHKFNPSVISHENSNPNCQVQAYEKLKKRYNDLKTKHKKIIEDNKSMRTVNKGLSKVINEVIKCISSVMENDANQELVLKILRILNTHHCDLIQRTVNKPDTTLNDSCDFTSTTIDLNEKENNFEQCIQGNRKPSVEKNYSNITSYKSNLDKVDRILQEHKLRNQIEQQSLKSSLHINKELNFAKTATFDKSEITLSNEKPSDVSEIKLMNITSNISNLHFNRRDISMNSCSNKELTKADFPKIAKNYSSLNNVEKENAEFDSICKHLNEESITEEEFYQNDEFEYDVADHEIEIDESNTPSMLILKQKNCLNPCDFITSKNN